MAESFRKMMFCDNDIISNISYLPGKKITLHLPDSAAPRMLMKEELDKLNAQYPDSLIILAVRFVGRRVVKLTPEMKPKFIQLLDGRRHCIYYGLAQGKRTHVAFSWYKLKHFSHEEQEFLNNNLCNDSFECSNVAESEMNVGNARFLIVKTGGVTLENLIYRYCSKYFTHHVV